MRGSADKKRLIKPRFYAVLRNIRHLKSTQNSPVFVYMGTYQANWKSAMRYTIFPHFYALGWLVCNSAIAPFSVCENADRFQNNVISRKTKSQIFIASCNIVECVNMQTENTL